MATSSSGGDNSKPTSKRKASDKSISPPPVKRKTTSTISKGAVASFFTPTSKKPKARTVWTERAPEDGLPTTLLVGRFEPEGMEKKGGGREEEEGDRRKRRKIAAFDLDSTLIVTSSGKKFGNDPSDWKWWDPSVPDRLRKMYTEEGYQIVILSNQAGLKLHPDPNAKGPKGGTAAITTKVTNFKQKCAAVLAELDLPTTIYAATGRDIYRKPRTGMWDRLCDDYNLGAAEGEIDLESSVFVGDAGGRTARLGDSAAGVPAIAKDFSCSDRNFAHNVGIAYKTPEEFFLGEPPREFARDFDLATYPYAGEGDGEKKSESERESDNAVLFEKTNKQDIVLFCGPPGAGKSTFFWKFLQPLGYERINQDILKTRPKCLKAADEALETGSSVVVDNTNPDPNGRMEWIELARKHDVPIRCVWFKIPRALCEHNDAVRALNKSLNPEARTVLPGIAFNTFYSRLREPTLKEGFQHVLPVEFQFRGTREEYAIWGRYWT